MFEKIQEKEKKRQQLIAELFDLKEMVRGSFCTIHVKCGKKIADVKMDSFTLINGCRCVRMVNHFPEQCRKKNMNGLWR